MPTATPSASTSTTPTVSGYILSTGHQITNPDNLPVLDLKFFSETKITPEVIETAHDTRSQAAQISGLEWLVERIDNFIESAETSLRR